LWLNNTPLCTRTTFSLSIHLLLGASQQIGGGNNVTVCTFVFSLCFRLGAL
jgi:hypothetical protein